MTRSPALYCGLLLLAALPAASRGAPEPPAEPVRAAAELALQGSLPPGSRIEGVFVKDSAVVVRLELPEAYLYSGGVTDESLEALSRRLDLGLQRFAELRQIHITARDPRDPQRRWRTLPSFLPRFDRGSLIQDREPAQFGPSRPHVRRIRDGAASGALEGKLIFISQCHGWLDSAGGWDTQRGITHGIVEDFVNPEAVNQFLLDYLRNAGADVFTLRESDLNTSLRIVDDADGVAFPQNGTYVETGPSGLFQDSGGRGFRRITTSYSPTENPFDNGGSDRLMTTAPAETARVTWTPDLPAAGFYNVYVSYSRDGAARASDAHYIVRHTGGETHFRIDQERHGWTWVPLGRFHFEAGHDPERGSVVLANDSAAEPGATVSADAVRFGGGFGDVRGEDSNTLSGRPRWEEGARSYTQYQGAPASVWAGGDVGARSKYAAWEHFGGEDSVYVSWHSNAFNGSARGTSSYIYSSNPPDGSYDPNEAAPGSAELMNRIHDEIVQDIRAGWASGWQDRGYRSAYFGEVNPAYNNEMPSTLLEVAFHDNAQDAEALKDPRFRRLLARAIYQGIVKYFAERDGIAAKLLPEPPREPEAHGSGPGSVTVSWTEPVTDAAGLYGDAAESYRVYLGTDGRGFDEGTPASGLSIELTGLEPGQTYYVRVTALNQGGESFPTETLAVRLPAASEPRLLLVGGFDRLDRALLVQTQEPELGGTVYRMFLDRMNRFDYLVEHAEALRGAAVALDSASNEAVGSGRVPLGPAAPGAVLWQLGEESTADESLSAVEQARLQAYLESGGRLFISGAELAWDLDHLGSAADRSFYRDVLGSAYVADDAGVYSATGAPGSSLAGIPDIPFDDGTQGSYNVEYPDVLAPQGQALRCMNYSGGQSGACIQLDTGLYRVVNLGFPFESIYPASKRAEVLEAALAFLQPPVAPTRTATPTRTVTPASTNTPAPDASQTPTRTPTPTRTVTQTPQDSATPGASTPAVSLTPTRTATPAQTPQGSATPTSPGPVPSGTRTASPTASAPSATSSATPTPTGPPPEQVGAWPAQVPPAALLLAILLGLLESARVPRASGAWWRSRRFPRPRRHPVQA
jgi:N-acetylmuramoyl-L-alanine amidase